MKKKPTFLIIFFIFFIFYFSCVKITGDIQRLSIYKKNPYYFTYKGKPILLLGGSDEDNLFNHPELMIKNLETLKKIGGNYIRCTMSSRDSGNVWPFARKANGKYDLNEFNPEYWFRFEKCLKEAQKRDIIVQVEMWATFDFYRDNWEVNPFNPSNNVNYSEETTRLVSKWPYHPALKPQPFFFSVPSINNDTLLLQYQMLFVDKLLSISFNYGNVLYCLDNETRAPAEWAWFWAEYIHQKASQKGIKILLTEMWDAHDLHDEEHERTYRRPDLFAFFDISQNNWQEGQKHYDNTLWIREIVKEYGGARPLTNVKVYHRRSGRRPNNPLIGLDRWWQNIWAGCASTRFHRPTGGTGLNELSQKAIHAARVFTNKFNIFACSPHPELLANREENEAYCLAQPGVVYALYFPKGGEVVLKLENPDVDWKVRWFDPQKAEFLPAEKHSKEELLTLTAPDTLQTWLVLVEK